MKETDEYLKMKLKKQWRTTTLNYNLVLLEMEGMVVLTDDGYKVTKDGKTKISTLEITVWKECKGNAL